jgi:hypothetical protein
LSRGRAGLANAATGQIDGRFANQAAAGRRILDEEGVPLAEIVVGHEVDLLFRGQTMYSGCR